MMETRNNSYRDVYIVDGARTPFRKAKGKPGTLSASDMALQVGRDLLARQPFQPKDLGEDGFAAQGGKSQTLSTWAGGKRVGIGPVDEINIDETGKFISIRRLNGDQTHQGRHVRIGVDDFQILHVKLYEYQ